MLLMRLMNKILPDCEEVARRVSESLDEPIGWRRRLGMTLHMVMCQWCRRNYRQQHQLRRLIRDRRQLYEAAPSATLSPEARDRINRLLAQAGDPGPDPK